ncbi:MAG: carbamoyl phosphate synthase [Nitrospinaceae bacterium]|nr:MAG: carbamoyl phosphate synthase [Nitrospinaceae bacterium]
MKALNLLFLAPHWRVSLVRSFQKAKTRQGVSGKLVGADSDPLAPALRAVDAGYSLPLFKNPVCKTTLLDICRREAIHVIFPLTNKAVEFLNCHRPEFEQENILAYLQDPETIEICHDKQKLADFFKENHIPSPLMGKAQSGFPLIAKPRRGEGSKNHFMIENPRDLEFYADKFPDHVIQQYVQGQEYTVDWFSDKSGKPLLVVPRERLAIRGGEVMVSRIRMDSKIIESVRQVGLRLNLKGPANLQGICPPGGELLFTDINLRFGSGSGHTIAAGGDIPECIFSDLLGQEMPCDRNSIEDGNVMSRFHEAFFFPGVQE